MALNGQRREIAVSRGIDGAETLRAERDADRVAHFVLAICTHISSRWIHEKMWRSPISSGPQWLRRSYRQGVAVGVVTTLLGLIDLNAVLIPVAACAEPGLGKANALAYPRHVPVPQDLPSTYDLKPLVGPGPILIFPVAIYVGAHYEGWQSFLKHVGNGGDVSRNPAIKLIMCCEPFRPRGEADGIRDCRAVIVALLRRYPEDTVRQWARESYRPIPLAPEVRADKANPMLKSLAPPGSLSGGVYSERGDVRFPEYPSMELPGH